MSGCSQKENAAYSTGRLLSEVDRCLGYGAEPLNPGGLSGVGFTIEVLPLPA